MLDKDDDDSTEVPGGVLSALTTARDVNVFVNVAAACRRGVHTVDITTPGHVIWKLFRQVGMRRFVVVDCFHRPVGLLTRRDMVFAEQSLAKSVRDETAALDKYAFAHSKLYS